MRESSSLLEKWFIPERNFPLTTLLVFWTSVCFAAAGAWHVYQNNPLAASLAPGLYAVVLLLTCVVWLISIPMKDVSIVDIWWGAAFPVQAWAIIAQLHSMGNAIHSRQTLMLALVTLWGGRLCIYLICRKIKEGWVEDHRYMQLAPPFMRRGVGPIWAVWLGTLGQIFLLQAGLVSLVGMPIMATMSALNQPPLGALDVAAAAVFFTGLIFEAGADYQLATFRADENNKGKVLSSGFFYYTRHPNYFGDFCIWTGLNLITCIAVGPNATLASLGLMYVMLRYVSGAALLDSCQAEVKPKYRDYIKNHSCFFPWPPRGKPL